MITIPFYNHYFHTSETEDTLRDIFGIMSVTELPCLCRPTTHDRITSPVALVHGSRDNDFDCYGGLKDKILANPKTHFYVWAVNFDLNEAINTLIDEEKRPLNCKVIKMKNIGERIGEIEELIKKLAN